MNFINGFLLYIKLKIEFVSIFSKHIVPKEVSYNKVITAKRTQTIKMPTPTPAIPPAKRFIPPISDTRIVAFIRQHSRDSQDLGYI